MRRFILIAILAALAAPSAWAESAPIPVKLGVSGRPDQASLELALRRGYFEKQGLAIETVQASSGMEFVSSLAADQLQVASGSPNAALFNALNRGIDIRIVADFAHIGGAGDRTVAIMVRSDLLDGGAIKTPADLKGHSLAGGPGAAQITDVMFDRMFRAANIKASDVDVRHLTFADSLSAMGTKSLDSAFMVEPLVTMGEQKEIARVLVDGGTVYPGGELSVFYFSPGFAKNKDAATKFMVAFLQGARDYYDAFFLGKGKDEAIKLLVQYLPVKDPALWQTSRQNTDVNGHVNVDDLKYQAAFYKSQGYVTGAVPDIDKQVDTEFADAAVKILGRR
ncbi:MAG TPA: ABC transporter substrate-binding protein [Stellaceae bacterium]|nr:ABC transporter substrate-binding protein [Stellaceae bacterium]